MKKNVMMDLSDNMGPYKTSTMLDLVNRKPMEVKYLFRKAVDRANDLNVSTPILDTLVTQIEFLQRIHNLY
jgi:ketopantoate reductase